MKRVLLVDDKDENRYLLRVLLAGRGWTVDEARHGAEALGKARQSPLDLIISDLLMPEMDGYTLLRQWKADERLQRIPFIVYTATYTDPKDERLALDLGADAFIIKPTEPELFLEQIEKVRAKVHSGDWPEPRQPVGEEKVLLKEYSEALVRKLEARALQLEQANRHLAAEIIEHKQAEEALAMMRFSVDRAGDSIFWISRAGRILYANDAACAGRGYSREELLGMDIFALDPDYQPGVWGPHFEDLKRRGTITHETRHRTKDGRVFPVEVNANYVFINGQEFNFATLRDLTERRKQERLALRSQRMESIGTLAGGIAHDLNNALAPILMSGELLRMQYPQESTLLDAILACTGRAADMVRQLLNFAKGAEGERVALQPGRLVREMEKLVQGSFPKNIRLAVKCDPKLPPVRGDATQLHQVLLNLCVNARDAMPDGGTLTLAAERREVDACYAGSEPGARPGSYVVLCVRDTGTGIPPEILDRIFDPFFTTKDPDKGTGLGLSTVLGIVKGHGGFLQVCSQPGHGTTFTVHLPVDRAGSESAAVSPAPEVFRGHGETILFVDDEAGVREVARAVLHHLNFKAVTATDGTDGLLQAAQHRTEIRAIITDLHMARLDGLAFVREVRRLLPHVPIAVASGRMDDEVGEQFRTLGVTGRLDKPFSEAQLAEALKNLLAPT